MSCFPVRRALSALGAIVFAWTLACPAAAAPKKEFKIAWGLFAGYVPLGYAAESGRIKKWADKYGIAIDLVQVKDYVDSVNQYAAGAFDGAPMTNMDALTIPAAAGVDSTALFVMDFSNGADGIVLKNGETISDIRGRTVHLMEFSVSHYLLARALSEAGLSETDVKVVNTPDVEIVSLFHSSPEVTAVVTWNPQLSMVAGMKDATKVFDSANAPGEIIDVLVINSETLRDNPDLGKALTGAWYEVMGLVQTNDADALSAMGWASGTDADGYVAQLATIKMFFTPAEALAFATSEQLPKTMDLVRAFSFDHGLLGKTAASKDAVGMTFPGGMTLGDPEGIKLRFDAEFMRMAAEGKL